ncbi:hypothetical protein, partial [Kitasatospora sp. NPDC007106]|uniref:hypothetical protein n=1 Tax=Kitasatospora sp. NPDC007106 TaxID=3156914 RepID=UPI0033F418FE
MRNRTDSLRSSGTDVQVPGRDDELRAWRHHFWAGGPPPGAARDLLGALAAAEYGRAARSAPDPTGLPAADLAA